MKKDLALIATLIIIIGCAGRARVEIGLNDETILAPSGTFGDIGIRILKIELSADDTYNTIWEGSKLLTVPIQEHTFVSITDIYIDISPGTYKSAKVTIDSLWYVQQNINKMLSNTDLTFIANASFGGIVIEDGDETKWVINIMSPNWFELDSLRIKPGHNPFEGAALKVYY